MYKAPIVEVSEQTEPRFFFSTTVAFSSCLVEDIDGGQG